MFWLVLLLFISTTIIGELLKPKTQKPHAGALGDFNFPTAQEGRAIPYMIGECKIDGGNTVWWGDLKVVPLKKRASFLSFSSQVVGFQYYIGVQYALCWGDQNIELIGIDANKKNVPYTTAIVNNGIGTEDRRVLTCTGFKLFGGTGTGGEGGFAGKMDFYRGLQSQQPNDYLTAKQGRVVFDQSTGLGYTYAGAGNGTLGFLSGGSSAVNETITITDFGFIFDPLSTFFGKAVFTVDGSVSGHIGTAYADFAFSSGRINFTIATGSTPFTNGDRFTVKTMHSHTAPAYKGICYAVLEQMYVGLTAYPKPLAFRLRRCPDPFGQGAGVAKINNLGNGVLGIYELMTSKMYGRGIPAAKFNETSFKNAAVTIAAEGLGISFQQDSIASADSIIGEILRHLDGVIYTDPATGLWTITLARADYDPATLPVLDVSSIEAIDYARGSWGETTNHVIVTYLSRASNFNERTVQAYDPANINITREVRSESLDFKMVADRATASLIAMRALKTLTYPIGKIKITANRKAWNYRMGGVFKVNWAPLGIVGMIFRVTHIAYGEVSSGKITIDAVEDIFGINNVAFVSPPESGWINPVGAATPCSAEQMIELPYLLQQHSVLPLGIYALAMAARDPAVAEKSFDIWLNPGSGFADSGIQSNFCPVGVLNAAYGYGLAALDATGFVLSATGGVDLDTLAAASPTDFASGINLCMIDDEIMGWTTPTLNVDGTYAIAGVARGLLDTVPANHAMGAKVFFFSLGANVTQTVPYVSDLTVLARFTPNSAIDQLAISSAPDVTLTTRSRHLRPYPPGNISVNGHAYGVRPASVPGDFTVTWKSRNRLSQGVMVQQDAADITGEVGQFFTVQKKIAGVAVGGPVNVGSAETFTYTADQRGIDDPDFTKLTTLEISSNVGLLASYFAQVVSTKMFGAATTLPSPGRYEFSRVRVGGLLL